MVERGEKSRSRGGGRRMHFGVSRVAAGERREGRKERWMEIVGALSSCAFALSSAALGCARARRKMRISRVVTVFLIFTHSFG